MSNRYSLRLLVPVGDSAFGQVIRRQFERNAVTSHDLDAVAAKPAGHGGQHRHARVELDGEHTGSEFFYNLAHYFNRVFF